MHSCFVGVNEPKLNKEQKETKREGSWLMNCSLVIIMVGGMHTPFFLRLHTPLVRMNFNRAKTQKRQKVSLKLFMNLYCTRVSRARWIYLDWSRHYHIGNHNQLITRFASPVSDSRTKLVYLLDGLTFMMRHAPNSK